MKLNIQQKCSRKFISTYSLLFLALGICSCDSSSTKSENRFRQAPKGEFIYRTHDEYLFKPPIAELQAPPSYPWQQKNQNQLPTITKAFFRCRGCNSRIPLKTEQKGQAHYVMDCGGPDEHSLPLRDGKEFIYPILIHLLNYIQNKTERQVKITAGHRCPDHQLYVDPLPDQQKSKHQIGAEVTFYVEGLENSPERIVGLLQDYFLQTECYKGLTEYQQFERWQKGSDTAIAPWCNKEVFIKLYQKNEGRNLDNDHSFPYINIQVRYDREKKERVNYSWQQAFHGFYRY